MLSWLPMCNAWLAGLGMVSIFLWSLGGVLIFLSLMVFCSLFLLGEVVFRFSTRYVFAFWLFIMSEVAVFGSLFVSVLWGDTGTDGSLSDKLELPLLGCFLLLTSSLTATVYHHCFSLPYGYYFLVLSLFLGACFIVLQFCEFYDCYCDFSYCSYFSAAFCTVGLHFLHVVLGLVAITVLLVRGSLSEHFYVSVVVWYWHFVDYVWLWVYMVVYYV
uniref:Cytochrome c oxidase subunit 3 n=1 Tax=Amphimerus sp. JM-2019 TaxID=2588351 RepID=A0A4Y5SET6_9TREM|nr:cytochrome c oxidase subunit 3 [Amphimerus sp. JM-2019]